MKSRPRQKLNKFTLRRTSTLFECERLLTNVVSSTAPIRLCLPSDDRRVFLKDLRVAAIISAASHLPTVTCEWPPQVSTHTYKSLMGLAATVYGTPPADRQQYASVTEARRSLAERLDILEDPPGSKETLTFCAIDEETRRQPIALSGLSSKAAFTTQFGKYVKDYFDRGPSVDFSASIAPGLFDQGASTEEAIYGFVYELYQNTVSHGSLNEHQDIVRGLRTIRLRKRVGSKTSRDSFIRGAKEFGELENYLEETTPAKGLFKFYEISISDNGMGILSRFRTSRSLPKGPGEGRSDDLELLNHIVAESLSSDTRKSKFGEGGLQKALRAVDRVRGFVSLRTDDLWVFRSPESADGVTADDWLTPVKCADELSRIPGTHFSLILRAS